MIETKIQDGTRWHVEQEIRSIHFYKREIVRLRNEIVLAGPDEVEIRGTGISDPTAKKAVTIATNRTILHMERVIDAIEAIVNDLPPDKKRFVQLYYWTSPRTLTAAGIAMELHIHTNTLTTWRREIVRAVADKMGWR